MVNGPAVEDDAVTVSERTVHVDVAAGVHERLRASTSQRLEIGGRELGQVSALSFRDDGFSERVFRIRFDSRSTRNQIVFGSARCSRDS